MFNGFFVCGTTKELRFAITPLRKMECLQGEPEGKEESCGYFKWRDTERNEDPFDPICKVNFSMPPSHACIRLKKRASN